MKRLTIEDVYKMVATDESRTLEFKQTTGELYKAMTSACAFLNTDGGWVLFGVTPKLKVVGQNVTDPTRREIAKYLRMFEPAIDVPVQYIELPKKPGFYVIALYFHSNLFAHSPYVFDGKPYYKVENTTSSMPLDMFEERIRLSNPRRFSWENRILRELEMTDIDADKVYSIVQMGVQKGRIPGSALAMQDVGAILTHLHLTDDHQNMFNAVNVLFGKDPTKFHIQCKVRLARFEGTEMAEFRDQTVCYGNLFEQYDAIISFCQKHLFLAGKMEQIERVDTLSIPFKALRETVLNLLVHRNWDAGNLTPSVAIYDDRVEFWNPGHFPAGNTYQDFIDSPHSFPVNPMIADVFYRSGLMEAWGRGISNIYRECKDAGMPLPEFKSDPHFVILVLRFKNSLTPRSIESERLSEKLSERLGGRLNERLSEAEEEVYRIICSNPNIQLKVIGQHTGKGKSTLARYIAKLVELDLVERTGSRKSGGYCKKQVAVRK